MIETGQNIDAENINRWFPREYDELVAWVEAGRSEKWIDRRIGNWFGDWRTAEIYRRICRNAARSIQRQHDRDELEKAKEALKGAGDKQ